jgi:hypothetical protein
MPLQLPNLDDRNFEQLLDEARRRIPVYTPEWTNFNLDSDPGITIVQLFAFLTESLLYRANRIPERNRLKFLQLLGIPLRKAAAAEGIIIIKNERGPVEALTLNSGVVVAAGNVKFLTQDPVTVLPVEAQIYYKRPVPETDPRFEEFKTKHEAIQAALEAAADTDGDERTATDLSLDFYETTALTLPTPGNANPVVDLVKDTIDRALYIALLAPNNVNPEDVRQAIANKVLCIGVVPALADEVPPLAPPRSKSAREAVPNLRYEIADATGPTLVARYERLSLLRQPDVLSQVGIAQLQLPSADKLGTWVFDEPEQEGAGDFPPRIDDEKVAARVVTWVRLILPADSDAQAGQVVAAAGALTGSVVRSEAAGTLSARITWAGINATRVTQAIPVVNELLGTGNGEPDQTVVLANTPVIESSVFLEVQDDNNIYQLWRMTDDLLSAGVDDLVFTLDPEAGLIRFGTGLNGARPQVGKNIRASYQYGGGAQGNVAIGAIKTSPDVRLQGGYKIENPVATWGGQAGETVAQGERNIPLYLRHRDRLVTSKDFEDVTRRAPGVDIGRVEVLPLFLPRQPDTPAAGVVTVMVIPATDSTRPLWPLPNRLLLNKVCDHLGPRKLVTTEIYVRGPEYVDVYVSVGIQVRGGYFRDLVRESVTARLNTYLSALPPGGPEGTGWPLNKQVLQKDLEAVVTRVPGVDFVVSLEIGAGTTIGVPDIPLTNLQLPRLAGLSVVEGEAEPLALIFGAFGAQPPQPTKQVVPVPVTKSKC